jgi:hypothetical protein
MLTTFARRLQAVEAAVLPQPQVQVPDACTLFTRAIGPPDAWQRQVLLSAAPRTLLNCSRQSGKSSCVAVLGLHVALSHPGSLILLLSPSLRQSQELFRKVIDAYRALGHPVPLQAESALRYELNNGSRLIALPGTEPTIRGYAGVDLLVIDEAARVSDELYLAARPMLAVSAGTLICLSTPAGMRGFFYEAWTQGQDWQKIEVPAWQCPRLTPEFLAGERAAMPLAWYQAEYECQFSETAYNVFTEESIQLMLAGDADPWTLEGF